MSSEQAVRRLAHGRLEVCLRELDTEGAAPPLLALHELGGSSEDFVERASAWPGPVFALDFAGHGDSDRLRGGGYYSEYFLADADLALASIDREVAVVGAGLGAYVAMLLAGTRTDRVLATLLLPGRGAAGGGALPDFERAEVASIEDWEARVVELAAPYRPGTDPMVSQCERDIRPDDYARDFAKSARCLLLSEDAEAAPSWWRVAEEVGGRPAGRGWRAGLERLASSLG